MFRILAFRRLDLAERAPITQGDPNQKSNLDRALTPPLRTDTPRQERKRWPAEQTIPERAMFVRILYSLNYDLFNICQLFDSFAIKRPEGSPCHSLRSFAPISGRPAPASAPAPAVATWSSSTRPTAVRPACSRVGPATSRISTAWLVRGRHFAGAA